ncbi:hypothetical protein HY224_00045 [Candidatus Uhrbacteria bacterium]|nr:hypothetical protein [Candidatus Uhrbacteria bacterium]
MIGPQNFKIKNQPGFTLMEMTIFVFLVGAFTAAVVLLANQYVQDNQKARSYQDVQQNARFAMQRIIQEIRGANDLTAGASTFGVNPGVLTVSNDDAAKDPTIFDISNGRLRIKQGTGAPQPLTSDKVRITNLVFTNLSVNNKTKNIRIQMTVQHYNPSGVNFLSASTSLEATAVIREQQG